MSTVPAEYRTLVDDAAVFPPGSAPLADAVTAHHAHRRVAYADVLGTFVVSDRHLPDLPAHPEDEPPLRLSVVVSGGAGAIEPAVVWAGGAPGHEIAGLELRLRDEEHLAHNAARVVTAVDHLWASGTLDQDVPVYVEPPRFDNEPGAGWLSALDEVAAMDLRLKFRTGGEDADAFPAADELAASIAAALDRELAFKCTAGLHHAVRHRDAGTGFEHHGFLNVLLATRASLDGDGLLDVAEVLDMQDRATLRTMLHEHGSDALVSARRWFTGFGSCSVLDPVHDLADLDLLPDLSLETR